MSEEQEDTIVTHAHAHAPAREGEDHSEALAPVIRKRRGRPKGWRKPAADFQAVEVQKYVKDDMTLLKEELTRLENQLTAMRNRNTVQWQAPAVQVESPAFKGRPLPDPLPEGFPEIDPLSGDKTPAVVEWFRDNDPAEFEARYKTRITHLNPKASKDQKDYVIDEETGKRMKLMARTDDKSGLNTSPRTYGG